MSTVDFISNKYSKEPHSPMQSGQMESVQATLDRQQKVRLVELGYVLNGYNPNSEDHVKKRNLYLNKNGELSSRYTVFLVW